MNPGCLMTVLKAAMVASLALGGLLPGCVQVGGKEPLVSVNGTGYGGARPAPVDIAAIPPGPEHQVCREQLGRSMDQVAKLQKDLDNCKADRRKDKDRWESEKSKLEQEKKQLKGERDFYKDRVKKLGGDV